MGVGDNLGNLRIGISRGSQTCQEKYTISIPSNSSMVVEKGGYSALIFVLLNSTRITAADDSLGQPHRPQIPVRDGDEGQTVHVFKKGRGVYVLPATTV